MDIFRTTTRSKEFAWTCGGDKRVSHVEHIDNGATGEVHKLLVKKTNEAFARKLIRVNKATRSTVENEAKTISKLMNAGRHPNVVHIWTHGWLSGAGGFYFIDMEFGEFTLNAYIKYLHHDGPSTLQIEPDAGVCVRRDCSEAQRAHNLWVIAAHIARGLQFLHQRRHVHRDLKPNNVLYFAKGNAWKLTDFGISVEATSSMISTSQSRGTGGYRAPELLKEDPKFSRSVDLWALGCVLYEIAMGKRPFSEDWAVFHYATSRSESPPTVQRGTEFYRHHINGVLWDLLSCEPQQRPKISKTCSAFDSYSLVFGLQTHRQLYGSGVLYPSYQEWKRSLDSDVKLRELYFRVTKDLLSLQEWDPAISLLTETIQSVDTEINLFPPQLTKRGSRTQAISFLKAVIHAYPKNFDFHRMLADCYARFGLTADLDIMFRMALNSASVSNPRLIFRELSIVYLEAGLEPPMLSAEQEEMAYPWTAIRMSHKHALDAGYIQAMDTQRHVLRSNKTNWSRLISDLLGHFENRKTAKTDSRDDRFKLKLQAIASKEMNPTSRKLSVSEKTFLIRCASNTFRWQKWDSGEFATANFWAWTGNLDLIKAKVERVATIDHRASLQLASWNMHGDIVKHILSTSSQSFLKEFFMTSPNPMFPAIETGDVVVLKLWHQKGGYLFFGEDTGLHNTFMHYAAKHGHVDVVNMLNKIGVGTGDRNVFGETPMHWAAEYGHPAVIEVLCNLGADPSSPNRSKSVPMHYAARYGKVEAVEMLISRGASVTISNKSKQTPLHLAACNKVNVVEVLEVLREAGADIQAVNENKRTPSDCAVSRGNKAAIEYFQREGFALGESVVGLSRDVTANNYNDEIYTLWTKIDDALQLKEL